MGVAARHRGFVLALWLCLATVLAHSVLPVGSPLAPRHGSAFSASTSDVALSPNRRQHNGESEQLGVARDGGNPYSGGGESPALAVAFVESRPAFGAPGEAGFVAMPAPRDRAFIPGARPRAPPPA